MKPIIQEEETGCGIAAVATIVQLPYAEVKAKANSIGIFAEDKRLFSDTNYGDYSMSMVLKHQQMKNHFNRGSLFLILRFFQLNIT